MCVMCVRTISVSVHLLTGFVAREDREDICVKALRFQSDCDACLRVQECVPFCFDHIRSSEAFPGELSVSLIVWRRDQVQPRDSQGVSH